MSNIKGVPTGPARFTMATLPPFAAPSNVARIIYVADGRKGAEGAGAGTGNLAFSNGLGWFAVDTGLAIAG